MSLSVQHLNTDATFLITFHLPSSGTTTTLANTTTKEGDFSILLDPWLHSDAPVFHPRFSNQLHTVKPAVNSLLELSPAPDLIIVSQSKSDHCHEETLKEFDWSTHLGTRLYACPDASSIIKGWKWFPSSRMTVFKKSERVRVDIPNAQNPERPAWLELEFIPAKWPWEMPGLHSAIGIKYFFTETFSTTKMISTLFTPHSIPISALRSWFSRLPGKKPQLTLLLHPFKHIYSFMGGEISGGFPAGLEICKATDVGTWISTHDEVKVVEGFVSSHLTETTWDRGKVEADLALAGVKNTVAKELRVSENLLVDEGVVLNA